MKPAVPQWREIASDLRFPEGPVAMHDGTLLVVEIGRGTLTRIDPQGRKSVVADVRGGPNGAAIGPDGRCYVCNNGGVSFRESGGMLFPGYPPPDYSGGWIDAVDLESGTVERLYDRCDGYRLNAPNDIVFDAAGGFWFTDLGKHRQGSRERDLGAVYYAKADGTSIEQAIFPLEGPNGIGLSPDGEQLFVAESFTGRLWSFAIERPGKLRNLAGRPPWRRGNLHWAPDYYSMPDSLAVDAEGYVYLADIPHGGITVINPDGLVHERFHTPDELTTNICFGGPMARTMYVTLSSTGRLVSMEAPRPGLPLHWSR